MFLELSGALLITSFNLFTIVYKMFYAPESEDEEQKTDKRQQYGVLEGDDEELMQLNEDSFFNESNNEFGFEQLSSSEVRNVTEKSNPRIAIF